MGFIVALIVLGICLLALVVSCANEFSKEKPSKKCECGEHDECVSPLYITDRGGMYRKPNELMKCGKVRKQMEEINKLFEEEWEH